MNINDLTQGSYTPVQGSTPSPLNINDLQAGSFTVGAQPTTQPTPQTPSTNTNTLTTDQGAFGNLVSNLSKVPGQLGDFFTHLTSNEQNAGQDITAALPSSVTGVDQLNQANQQNAQSDIQFIQAMNARKQSGQSLTAGQQAIYDNILKTHAQSLGTAADLTPALNKTNEQVAGDFAGAGADILSAGSLPGAAGEAAKPAEGALNGFIQGAKAGAKAAAPVGAAYGLSSGLQNNESGLGVTGSTLFGALTGAAGGSIIGGTIGAVTANPKITTNYNSAITDVTPDYEQLTAKQKGQMLPQTQEGGILKGRTIVPGQQEENAAAALASMDNYNPKATALQKWQAVNETISSEAENLKTQLQQSNVVVPKKQVVSIVKNAVDTAAENSLTLQNTDPIIEKYVKTAQRAAAQNDGTLAGVLDIRKELDQAYLNARGPLASFNDSRVNALDEIHQAARQALNNYLIDNAPNADVKLSLKYQSALYNAQDALQTKAVKEGVSTLDRVRSAVRAHPLGALITAAAGTVGADAALKTITGKGL